MPRSSFDEPHQNGNKGHDGEQGKYTAAALPNPTLGALIDGCLETEEIFDNPPFHLVAFMGKPEFGEHMGL